MTPYTRWPSQGPKMNRLAQALEEIGRPLPRDATSAAISSYVRTLLGPMPVGVPAEHWADVALSRIAQ